MNNKQKGSASVLLIILVVILAAAVVYFAFIKKPAAAVEQSQNTGVDNIQPVTVQPVNTPLPQSSPTSTQSAPTATTSQQVHTTIYIPKNQTSYNQLLSNDQDGTQPGTASLTANDFTAQSVTVTTTPTYNIEQATADAAAATVKSQAVIKTVGFKVVGSTAYIVLNINIDGWAGVSYSIDAVTPIIKQTLLQFPDIKNVDIGSQEAFKVTGVPTP